MPFVVGAFALALVALPWMLELELNSDFQAMLPESAASVRDLDEIRSRFGGTSTLTLAVQAQGDSPDVEALHTFTRALVSRLEGRDDLQIAAVDWNIGDFATFVEERRHVYAPLADLIEVRDSLRDRLEWERLRANPFFIDLGDDAPPPDPEAVLERLRHEADHARGAMERFPGGFYQHPTEPIVFVFFRTSIRGGESGASGRLVAAIEDAADASAGSPARARRSLGTSVGWEHQGLRIDYGGDIMDAREETDALREAVEKSTIVTVVLLLISIFVFFGRVRALPLLGLAMIPPACMTFGIAEVAVDYLNASTAFLGSIVIGNGINANIMWLGRYFEERRSGRDVEASIAGAHEGTWAGTLAATVAAALAYASLMVTDYRGFRDFGLIGATGMTLCWAAAYGLLPALASLSERWRPLVFDARDKARKGVYGVLFARLALGPQADGAASRTPARVLVATAILTAVCAVGAAWTVMRDPLEYDFRNLQAERSSSSRVSWVNQKVGETVEETTSGSALALLAPRREDVPALRASLERYRTAHPGVLGATRTIEDLLPSNVAPKLPVLRELRQLLLEVRPYLSEERQRQVDEQLPAEAPADITFEDLPASVARPFIERDGTRGRLVFVEHAEGQSTWDGRYMIRWSEGARSARTEDGRRPAVAGIAVVFADLLETIFEDGPRAIGASFLATVLLLLTTFRSRRERLLSLLSMVGGVVWMLGLLTLVGAKINFLNMVAFPVTFGIGVEYGVNYVKRFLEERDAAGGDGVVAVRAALEGAGGAVILCSLTTLIGYVSLYTSANRALNSFGLAMSLGEITCVLASLISLPAALHVLESKKKRRAS